MRKALSSYNGCEMNWPSLTGVTLPSVFRSERPSSNSRRAEFVTQRKAIQIRALRDALAVLPAEQRAEVERRISLLQESRIEDASLDSMLPLPAVIGDDTIAAVGPSYLGWLFWAVLVFMLIALILLIMLLRRETFSSTES